MTTQTFHPLRRFFAAENLIWQILAGLVIGILAAAWLPGPAGVLPLFGTLFVGALKAIAPILVCILVTRSVAGYQHAAPPRIGSVIVLYIAG
ncbi:MAG: serine/threonine transporter SstT, partial [Rhodocyclaceae bacterium]|nr:serine/threonine transporter SstT [Rhodocyclaceae bacterium]